MGLPLALGVLAAGGGAYHALKDNSSVDKLNGTATWDVPWSIQDINFGAGPNGLSRATLSVGGEKVECYQGSRGGEKIFISTADGSIYNENGEETDRLSPGQFAALKEFDAKVTRSFNQTEALENLSLGNGYLDGAVKAARQHYSDLDSAAGLDSI